MKQWKPFSQGHNMCLLVGIGERAESVKGKVNSCPVIGENELFYLFRAVRFYEKKMNEKFKS